MFLTFLILGFTVWCCCCGGLEKINIKLRDIEDERLNKKINKAVGLQDLKSLRKMLKIKYYEDKKKRILELLLEVGDPASLPIMVDYFKEFPKICGKYLFDLGKKGQIFLFKFLHVQDDGTREKATDYIKSIDPVDLGEVLKDDEVLFDLLLEALKDKNFYVRMGIAKILGALHQSNCINLILKSYDEILDLVNVEAYKDYNSRHRDNTIYSDCSSHHGDSGGKPYYWKKKLDKIPW